MSRRKLASLRLSLGRPNRREPGWFFLGKMYNDQTLETDIAQDSENLMPHLYDLNPKLLLNNLKLM